MLDKDCLFCKIIQKQIPSKIIKETDHVLVIEDIAPKAPIHYLVIPKKHIININYLADGDEQFCWHMLKAAKDVAQQIQENHNLQQPLAFNFLANNGIQSGQSVFHLHWHFISGKHLSVDGSTL